MFHIQEQSERSGTQVVDWKYFPILLEKANANVECYNI